MKSKNQIRNLTYLSILTLNLTLVLLTSALGLSWPITVGVCAYSTLLLIFISSKS